MKKIYKYGTGMIVPDGAIYLTTVTQTFDDEWYVWHYFLVEDENETKASKPKTDSYE